MDDLLEVSWVFRMVCLHLAVDGARVQPASHVHVMHQVIWQEQSKRSVWYNIDQMDVL